MNDIDKHLQKSAITPSRALNQNFTETVMTKIQKKPKRSLLMRLRPAIALLALAFMIPGVVKAEQFVRSGWWDEYVSVNQREDLTKTLPNGNAVIAFTEKICGQYATPKQSFEEALRQTKTTTEYYEIKKDSGITPEDVRTYLRSNCEQSLLYDRMAAFYESIPKTDNRVILIGEGVIQAINDTSITIGAENNMRTIPITKPVRVTEVPSTTLALSDLKVGDTVYAFASLLKGKIKAGPAGFIDDPCSNIPSTDACDLFDPRDSDKYELEGVLRYQPPEYDPSRPGTKYVSLGDNVYTVLTCSRLKSLNGLCASGEMSQDGAYRNPVPFMPVPWHAIAMFAIGLSGVLYITIRARQS